MEPGFDAIALGCAVALPATLLVILTLAAVRRHVVNYPRLLLAALLLWLLAPATVAMVAVLTTLMLIANGGEDAGFVFAGYALLAPNIYGLAVALLGPRTLQRLAGFSNAHADAIAWQAGLLLGLGLLAGIWVWAEATYP